MKRSDIISGGLLVLFGLLTIFFIVPVQIDSGGDYGLDPKFFPVSLLWLVTVIAALLLLTRLPTPSDPPDEAPPLDGMNWLFIVGASLFFAAAYVAIDSVGFIPSCVVMIAFLMYAMGERRNWIKLIGISVAAPIIIAYSLGHIFTVELP